MKTNVEPRGGDRRCAGAPARTWTRRLWICAVLAALTAGVCGATIGTPDSGGKVLATVGTHRITERDVQIRARVQIARLQNQLYEVKKQAIEAIAADYLIDQAARRDGLTTAEYLKRKLSTPAANPTDKEIADFYAAHSVQIRQPLDKVRPAIISYLKQQNYKNRRQRLVDDLRQRTPLKVAIEPPRYEVIAGDGPALGPKSAPVTIVEFSDFQCPYCRQAETTVKQVRARYGDKVRLVFRNFPLAVHGYAEKAAEAGECAQEQNKFWPLHDAMFADQSKLGVAGLKASAARVGCDAKKFAECLDNSKYAAKVRDDIAYGGALWISGTPTFFVNGRYLTGAPGPDAFYRVIDEELAGSAQKTAAAR